MGDAKGNDSFVIAGVLKDQMMGSDTINQVKSVYPLDDFPERIKKSAESGGLVVINKNKAEQMLTTIGIQPAEVSLILNLAKDIVPQNNPNVKTQLSISDSDGNTLSEGQQKYFKDSEIRDENGNLMVMYHGTPSGDFTVFKDGTYFKEMRTYSPPKAVVLKKKADTE